MNYCPNCGGKLSRRLPDSDTRERDTCESCNLIHYENPKVLVVCLVYWQESILFCRRAIEPAKGHWNLPTGFVETGETLEEAASRELMEEAGIHVSPTEMRLYAVASLPHMNQLHVVYCCELPAAPTLLPGDESLEAQMFSEMDLPLNRVAFVGRFEEKILLMFKRLRAADFSATSTTIR